MLLWAVLGKPVVLLAYVFVVKSVEAALGLMLRGRARVWLLRRY
jgi:hypothetical protein